MKTGFKNLFHTLFLMISLLCFLCVTGFAEEDGIAGEYQNKLVPDAYNMHKELCVEDRFPSAMKCAKCHKRQFREWSVSSHAYAQLSVIFNSMQAKFTLLTNGSIGDFCIRCHTNVGMAMNEEIFTSNLERYRQHGSVAIEGITCIVCHRLPEEYGIVNGRLPIEEGNIFQPVYGPTGNDELQRVIKEKDKYKVSSSEEDGGLRRIHREARKFFKLSTSGMCGQCHDFRLPNGFRLEDGFSEWKASPAAKKGESCQDCHMGIEPGVASGYDRGPAAVIGGIPTRDRKLSNHMIAGPDYSIIHPGLYPHNPEAQEMATMEEWLAFDYKAGWGTDEFEDNVSEDYQFPERWTSIDDRYDGRDIIEQQFELLNEMRERRIKILQAGFQIGDIVTKYANERRGIRFKVEVKNGTYGHSVPTGLDAERIIFLQVTVTDRDGVVVFKSGDLDPNGDVRNLQSHYVINRLVPKDKYLFNLKSKWMSLNERGSEREQVLPVPYSLDPLPFVRPATLATALFRNPPGFRKQKRNIPPLGSLWATYKIKGSELTGKGPYTAKIRFRAGMVPVNLVLEIQDMGFDYGMSTKDVVDALLDGHVIFHEREVVFDTTEGKK